MKALEGVYAPSDLFESDVVLHATASTLSILAAPHAAFAILRPACLAGPGTIRLVLEGYWRYLDGVETGLVRLFVDPPEAAGALCAGLTPVPLPATLRGATGLGGSEPRSPMEIVYERARKDRRGRFLAGGHRGACQTRSACGASENSLGTLPMVEQLGGDLAEMDVRVTRDRVPILYHDASLNGDLSEGIYCVGKIAELTYPVLLSNCRLRDGEAIPTLAEALEVAGTRTGLAAVWLDVKVPAAIEPTIAVVEAFYARHPGASLKVLLGLPSDDVIGAYLAAARSPSIHCLVEEDAGDVGRLGCVAWAPRFTRGPMADTVRQLQSEGRFVAYWTLDDVNLVDAFLAEGAPNGILTSFLPMLVQRFETVGIVPPYDFGL